MKVESMFENDATTFRKAISEKLSLSKDGLLLKSLITFGKECFMTQRKGKKNAGRIPVQSTARSRRRIKHRGAGTSMPGRPTKEQSIRVQLQVNEEEDFVSFQIPSRNKAKPKHPHSLAASVAGNRARERKHLALFCAVIF